ncbi:MAG: sensor histidine kinase, partial [Pseudomonadota bacterium]
ALSLLVLFAELLVLILLFAGGPLSWMRLALMSLFVQWVALCSACALCLLRPWLNRLPLVLAAVLAFVVVLSVTGVMGVLADRLMSQQPAVDWLSIAGQLVIAGIIAGLALRYFFVQQQLRAREQAELKSRLQALQSRIRPHFLFNSMNIIASLIAVDPDTAETVVEDLSELFRASLNETGNQVRLVDELDLCRRYVRIEQLRLGDRLKVAWDLAAHEDLSIPLLSLQPLLENAIYHGIQPRADGGLVRVRLERDEQEVRISITNPLPAAESAGSSGNRMALGNIRSRMEVLYGNRAGLEARRDGDEFITRLYYPLDAAGGGSRL